MHMPFALTPLAGDYDLRHGRRLRLRLRAARRPVRGPDRVWNGYAYFAWRRRPRVREDAADEAYTAPDGRHPDDRAPTGSEAVPELHEHLRLDRGATGRDGRAS